MPLSRRTFLASLAASVAAPTIVRAAAPPKLPLAFSTLGCPVWSWKTILETADRLGYSENSTICRAFKRWTGESPQAFRREVALQGRGAAS